MSILCQKVVLKLLCNEQIKSDYPLSYQTLKQQGPEGISTTGLELVKPQVFTISLSLNLYKTRTERSWQILHPEQEIRILNLLYTHGFLEDWQL